MENKIKLNAEAFEKLLNIEYYFCLGYKGKGFEVRVRFAEEDFHHLEGIGQLRDLKIHSESGNIVTVHSHTARSSNHFAHSFQIDFVDGMRSLLHQVLTKCAA